MRTYKSESTVYPIEWDLTSSATLTYHHYNIAEKTVDSDTHYTYDVDEYRKAGEEKYAEISRECRRSIERGVEAETTQGVKHFSLSAEDRRNIDALSNKVAMVRLGMYSGS